MRISKITLLLIMTLIIFSCYDYNSPLDRESDNYQGWVAYAEGEDIPEDEYLELSEVSPGDGENTIDTTPLLDWDDLTGAASYLLKIAATESGMIGATAVDAGTTSEYQYSSVLSHGNVLWWQVAAVNGYGAESPWSDAISFTIDLTVSYTGISPADGATLESNTAPLLNWADVTGALSYEVRYASTAAGLSGATPITGLDASEYQYPEDLDGLEEVWWQITAVNDENDVFISGNYNFAAPPEIGDTYCGGIIFYLDGSGGGLVCAASDQGTDIEWGGHGTFIGSTATGIYTGKANTAAIVAAYGNAEPYSGLTNYAAKLCDDLVLEDYSDWFLPSRDALKLMYDNLYTQGLGGLSAHIYWSSSEASLYGAWAKDFSDGDLIGYGKVGRTYVRAVRTF